MAATPERRGARAGSASGSLTGASVAKPRNTTVACRKCHARKVRCSGGQPCVNCRQANCGDQCVYPQRDRQIKISQNYIDELLEENQRLRDSSNARNPVPTPASTVPTGPASAEPAAGDTADSDKTSTEVGDSVRNPLFEDRPWFYSFPAETPIVCLMSEATDTAFATRFRQELSGKSHSHIPRTQYVTDVAIMSPLASDCPWPAPARARFLVKVALGTICRRYYFLRRSSVMESLEQALRMPASCDRISACKLFALFALGELYSARAATSEDTFPGLAHFSRASHLLRFFAERPRIETVEVVLMLSLYSLSMNRRHASYCMAGSAMRFAILMGLHLRVPDHLIPDYETREHRKRVWWTTYIYDREWASLLGQPVTIRDGDFDMDLPADEDSPMNGSGNFVDSECLKASIRLCRLECHFNSAIYGRQMQQGSFSHRVQEALRELRNWIDHLPEHLRLTTDDLAPNTAISMVGLHLTFNQCVILITRPVLLHVFRMRRQTWMSSSTGNGPDIPETAFGLSEACIRCARRTYRMLTDLWISGQFATFDYFFTQYLFSATTILAISSLSNTTDSQADGDDFEAAMQLLTQLSQDGSFAAKEFCAHLEATKICMQNILSQPGYQPGEADLVSMPAAAYNYDAANATSGMPLAEPSLQDLLTQPNLDLQFLETSNLGDGYTTFFWPEPGVEGWTG